MRKGHVRKANPLCIGVLVPNFEHASGLMTTSVVVPLFQELLTFLTNSQVVLVGWYGNTVTLFYIVFLKILFIYLFGRQQAELEREESEGGMG